MRKLAVSTFQHNKHTMDQMMLDPINLMIEKIDSGYIHRSVSVDDVPLTEALVSCLWRGITQDVLEERDLKNFTENIFDFAQEYVSPLVQIVQHQRSLFVLTESLGWTHQSDLHKQINRTIKHFVEGLKDKSEMSPLVEAFLQQGKNPHHYEENLLWAFSDLLLVGSYTLWVHLQWGLLCLIKYPRWKIALKQECGQDSKPLTDAFITEVLRTFVVESKGLSYPVAAANDVQIGDYFLPKDTVIIHMLNEVMGDPKHFPNPKDFDPTRFVSYQSHDVPIYVFDPRVIPFGVGKRKCIGENIAKNILSSFLASLVDRYDILAGGDIKVAFNDAAIAKPIPFNVIFKPIRYHNPCQ